VNASAASSLAVGLPLGANVHARILRLRGVYRCSRLPDILSPTRFVSGVLTGIVFLQLRVCKLNTPEPRSARVLSFTTCLSQAYKQTLTPRVQGLGQLNLDLTVAMLELLQEQVNGRKKAVEFDSLYEGDRNGRSAAKLSECGYRVDAGRVNRGIAEVIRNGILTSTSLTGTDVPSKRVVQVGALHRTGWGWECI